MIFAAQIGAKMVTKKCTNNMQKLKKNQNWGKNKPKIKKNINNRQKLEKKGIKVGANLL